MLNPVSGRCTQYFGDVLRQIQFQTEPEGYFLDAGQEPPKRGIFRFPIEAARISNHNLKRAGFASGLRQVQRQHWACLWAQEDSPNCLFCPPRKEEWGKEKGSRCPEKKKAENLRLFLQQDQLAWRMKHNGKCRLCSTLQPPLPWSFHLPFSLSTK